MIRKLLLVSITIVSTMCGCSGTTYTPESHESKLNNMIRTNITTMQGMNSRIGAVVGYNIQRFSNKPKQCQSNYLIPTTQFEYQLYKKLRGRIK